MKEMDKTMEIEKDSSKDAWEYYKKVYNGKFSMKIENIKIKNHRYLMKCFCEFNQFYIVLGGDCSFNFNEKKCDQFEQIIGSKGSSEEEKNEAKALLIYCKNKHHDNCNFALMPTIGGLNNVKGNIKDGNDGLMVHQTGRRPQLGCLDRLDSFICLMEKFYEIKSKKISLKEAGNYFNHSLFSFALKTENFTSLFDFLDSFDSTKDYLNCFYPWIDDELLKRIMQCGQIKMTNAHDAITYMKLAKDYWTSAELYFNKIQLKSGVNNSTT